MSSLHRLDPRGPAIYRCAQAGCQDCLNQLLEYHEGLIHLTVRQQASGNATYDELLQEGRLALWRAILRYDPARGIAFSSFACLVMRRQIWRAVVLAGRYGGWLGPPESWDPAEEVEAAWFWQSLRAAVAAALAQLPAPLRQIVCEYYGLAGEEPRSLRAVGQAHGFSRERARHLRNDGLLLLRLPALSALLRELVEYDSRPAYQHTQALNRHWLRQRRYYHIGWQQAKRQRQRWEV